MVSVCHIDHDAHRCSLRGHGGSLRRDVRDRCRNRDRDQLLGGVQCVCRSRHGRRGGAGASSLGAQPALRSRSRVLVADCSHLTGRRISLSKKPVDYVPKTQGTATPVRTFVHFAYLMSSIQILPFEPIFALTVSTTKRIDWTFDSAGVELVIEPSALQSSKNT